MEAAARFDGYYTYADYCTWPDGERWEIINGVAYAMAGPSQDHQSLLLRIARQFGDYLDGKPCKVFVAPFDVRLNAEGADDSVVQPDILVVCDEQKLDGGKGVVGAPDLVVEVLSPATAIHDRNRKYRLYQESGVREYWIADPDEKLLMVNVLRDGKYVGRLYFNDDVAVPVEVLDGCFINLAKAFENL